MGQNRNRKEEVFKLYSENLKGIKESNIIKINNNTVEYVCPLCIGTFTISDLESKSQNPLTEEHNPPEKLGGKVTLLTCKSCNSKCGSDLDAHLLNYLLENEFNKFYPNTKTTVEYKVEDLKIRGEVEIDKSGTCIFKLNGKMANPRDVSSFNSMVLPRNIAKYDSFFDPKRTNIRIVPKNFRISPFQKSKINRVNIALLKIAYLKAFEEIGFALLAISPLSKIREQIRNPDKNLLKGKFLVNYNFPDNFLGLNIIRYPKELMSFLLVFKLKTSNETRKFAVALPGPTSPKETIYENIENLLYTDSIETVDTGHCELILEHLPKLNFRDSDNGIDILRRWYSISRAV